MKKSYLLSSLVLLALIVANPAWAVTRIVNSTSNDANTVGTLPYWLLNASDGDIIDCTPIAGQTITLTSSLPAVTSSYVVNGAGITINGDNTYQAFQVASGAVSFNNINIQNALSKGGNGGSGYSGAGGGVGGGGALYLHSGTTVTLSTSHLLNNIARGGDGGSADNIGNGGGGGGGGFGGGDGGSSIMIVSTGGGGGGHSNGGRGGSNNAVNGSDGIYFGGGGGGAGINSFISGGLGGSANPVGAFIGGNQSSGNGGGGAGTSQDGFSAAGAGGAGVPGNAGNGIGVDLLFGGGGGGGGSTESGNTGGFGIGAGGGGGVYNLTGGDGGILGGGGGAGGLGGLGGAGGFGAGGGGAVTGGLGGSGFGAGGGNGSSNQNGNGAGGGGSGLGGAIFIQSNATLTLVNTPEISGNSAIAGVAGSSTGASDPGHIEAGDGSALGSDIFVREQGAIIFNLSNSLTLANPIEGDQTNGPNTTGGLQKIGTGTLNLNGANTYSGITSVDAGILNLNGSVIGNVAVGAAGTLKGNAIVSGTLTSSGTLQATMNNGGTSLISVAAAATISGPLELDVDPATPSGTYTVLTGSVVAGTFSAVNFSYAVPNGTLTYLPGSVQFTFSGFLDRLVSGGGTLSGNRTFKVKAVSNPAKSIVASMFFNDPAANIHFDNPVITSLTVRSNQITMAGTVRLLGSGGPQTVTLNATVTTGTPGTFTMNLGNVYSVSENLASGGITIR